MANKVNIAQDRYLWAIQRAGISLDAYMARHPKSHVHDWISETRKPTEKQLEDFAKSVNVPYGYLFVQDVPQERIPFPMFRGKAGQSEVFDLNVYDTVMSVRQRQNWLEDYLIANDLDTCKIVSTVGESATVTEAVSLLRKALSLEPRWAFSCPTSAAAVNRLTERLEDAGVFLVYNGIVGNNTRRPISVDECRGFALVNTTAPFIFINNSDSKTAQLFTLIHETVHLLLGVSAGHAGEDVFANNHTERYCDSVAAEFLVPAAELRAIWSDDTKAAAKKFKVSEIVVARKAHDMGLIGDDAYHAFWQEYQHQPNLAKRDPGGNFYANNIKRVGKSFAVHVRNAVNSRQLSYLEAYRLTGLYGNTYNHLMTKNI